MQRVVLITLTVGAAACDFGSSESESAARGDGGPTVDAADAGDASTTDGGSPTAAFCAELDDACDSRCNGSFDSVECEGSLSGSFDNVEVDDETCDLSNALITGNLIVRSGAQVTVGPDVFICGDMQADGAAQVNVTGQAGRIDVCGNLQASGVGSLSIGAGVGVANDTQLVESTNVTFDGATVCGDANFVENEDLSVGETMPTVIVGNCLASENATQAFSLFEVRGDNSDCL